MAACMGNESRDAMIRPWHHGERACVWPKAHHGWPEQNDHRRRRLDVPDGQWSNGKNLFDQAFAINAAPDFENDMRSGHTGGAQMVCADGSVHFLADELALPTLGALCTRADGDTVGDF